MNQPFYDLAAQHTPLLEAMRQAEDRVMRRGTFILGPEVEAFEEEFAAWCGVRNCVGCSNGLDALQLILRAAGIGPGDEIIVPAHTFVATWMAVSAVGATPVGTDCLVDTANVSPRAVEAAISIRTRAIIAVHLYGRPADMRSLRDIADRCHLLLIEDAAQAHGACIDGQRAGSLGDAAAFSFYPTKNLGALGDAGAVVTRRDDFARQIRQMRNYGSSIKYHHASLGLNARLDELQAALLRVKLSYLDAWNDERRELARRYVEALSGCSGLRLPPPDEPSCLSAWHLFTIRCGCRDGLQQQLARQGIQTLIHYPIPPHLQPAYAGSGQRKGEFPVTEQICDSTLSLPFYPGISRVALLSIAERIQEALAECAGGFLRSEASHGYA
jgi:dTDP-4-amino-4,6-dideoxygalactose transaminase